MMERYDIICGDMWRSKNGDYVRYLEARAEIERLKRECEGLRHIAKGNRLAAEAEAQLRKEAEAERDEATSTLELVNSNNLTLAAELAGWKQAARQMEAERDEARAQVAAAYEAAERALEARKYGDPDEREEYAFDAALDRGIVAIRALTPADAKAALEAYGREKVREGMQKAAYLYPQGIAAILAAMKKEGEK